MKLSSSSRALERLECPGEGFSQRTGKKLFLTEAHSVTLVSCNSAGGNAGKLAVQTDL